MATPEELASEKKNFFEGMDEMIAVVSKDGEVLARTHKEPLCAKSTYIAEMLITQTPMAAQHADGIVPELVLILPFDRMPLDEELVARSLVDWLYCQRIYIPDAVRETSDDLMGSFGFLCKLWVIAEKWQIQLLGNDVVDGIVELYLVNEYFPYSIIEFIYRETSRERSAIRKLFVSIVEIGLSTDGLSELENVMPMEFINDLNRKMSENQDESCIEPINKTDVCKRFHEHHELEGELHPDCVGIQASG